MTDHLTHKPQSNVPHCFQARRLALQREIDEESQPKANFGQWDTAHFDNSEKQIKFLRLMGGFKKGSQPIRQKSERFNMALGKESQQTLQQGLLGEFERAQNRRMDFQNKGAGLGFSAPSNKKFAIDANARNSIRFDD
uniref:Small acidic protein-like domain-containing protein n=1 Tax=Electrophorus electricus TaxID=8005 RepID=A0A4W4EMN0_ELEEL